MSVEYEMKVTPAAGEIEIHKSSQKISTKIFANLSVKISSPIFQRKRFKQLKTGLNTLKKLMTNNKTSYQELPQQKVRMVTS